MSEWKKIDGPAPWTEMREWPSGVKAYVGHHSPQSFAAVRDPVGRIVTHNQWSAAPIEEARFYADQEGDYAHAMAVLP